VKHLAVLCLAIVSLVSGCTNHDEGSPTGASCPTTNPPTYANFGQAFFTSSVVTRPRWPIATDIDREAATGPSATNRLVPFAKPDPTDDEPATLGEFLACERQAAK